MEDENKKEYRSLKEEILYHTLLAINKNKNIPESKKEREKEKILEIIYGMQENEPIKVKVLKIDRLKRVEERNQDSYM
jgi:hypothetical protein